MSLKSGRDKMLKPPSPGEVIQASDWLGEVLTIKVGKLFNSPTHGDCFDGYQLDEESLRARKREPVAYRYVALPLSHILRPARLVRRARGNWEVIYPDDTTQTFSSCKAAKDDIKDRGLTLQEV